MLPYIKIESRLDGERSKGTIRMAQGSRPRADRKLDRVEASLTKEHKEFIQYAAGLLGLSVSDFLITSAHRAGESVIREHNVIMLSAQDSLAFAQAILNPREPNEALRDAFTRHGRQVLHSESAQQ